MNISKKRITALFIAICMVLVGLIDCVRADRYENELLYDNDELVVGVEKLNLGYNTLNTNSKNRVNINLTKIKDELNMYGIQIKDIDDKIRIVSSPKNDSKYYKLIFDNGNNAVDVNESGTILGIKLLSDKSYINHSKYNVKSKILENLKMKGYNLRSEGYIDTESGILSMEFQKEIGHNIYNPYQSVSVIVDEKNNCIHGINTRDNEYDLVIDDSHKITNNPESLVLIKPKDYTINNDSSKIVLARKVDKIDKILYEEPNTGEIIGWSDKQSRKGKSLAIDNTWNGRYVGNMGDDGLRKLGYSMKRKHISTQVEFLKQLKGYLGENGTEKGLFINCHGSPTVLSNNINWNFSIDDLNRISKINRKCRIAYINACSTAVNTDWARGFGIIPGKWGAFIGWSVDVQQATGVLFAERFWRYADGTRPILRAVELAINDMPSSYTIVDGQNIYDDNYKLYISSPIGIRFIGNSTFYGNGN